MASRQRGRIIFKRNGNERKARNGKRGAVEDRGSGRGWMGWMGNCKMSSFASFPELNTGCSRIPEFLAPSFSPRVSRPEFRGRNCGDRLEKVGNFYRVVKTFSFRSFLKGSVNARNAFNSLKFII